MPDRSYEVQYVFTADQDPLAGAQEAIERGFQDLAESNQDAMASVRDGFMSLRGRLNDFAREAIGGMIDRFKDLGAEALQIEQHMETIGATIGSVIDNALQATSEIDGVSGAVGGLAEAIADANSPLGAFLRDGLQGIVTIGSYVVETVVRIVEGIRLLAMGVEAMIAWIQRSIARFAEEYMEPAMDLAERFGARVSDSSRQILAAMISQGRAQSEANLDDILTDMDNLSQSTDDTIARIVAFREALNAALETAEGTVPPIEEEIASVGSAASSSAEEVRRLAEELRALELLTMAKKPENEPLWDPSRDYTGSLLGLERSFFGGFERLADVGILDSIMEEVQAAQEESQALMESMMAPFQQLPNMASTALSQTMNSLGRFLGGAKGAFANFGEAVRSIVGGTFSSMGSAFAAAAPQFLTTFGLGPMGIALAAGSFFSLVGGMIQGGGGGVATAGGVGGFQGAPDVLTAIRPEVTRGSGSTVNYHVHTGAIFADREDETATRAVTGFVKRARAMGEMP